VWFLSLYKLWVLIISIIGVVIVIGVYRIVGVATNLYIHILVPSL
jgi:hypothetical protein